MLPDEPVASLAQERPSPGIFDKSAAVTARRIVSSSNSLSEVDASVCASGSLKGAVEIVGVLSAMEIADVVIASSIALVPAAQPERVIAAHKIAVETIETLTFVDNRSHLYVDCITRINPK